MSKPLPFQAPAGAHIIGQPFTLSNLSMPVNATFTCNCVQPGQEMAIVASAPVTCSACGKSYVVAFNPQNGQLMIGMSEPQAGKEPS